jgi:sugar-specific transcriptional regulator TrmB
MSIIIPQTKEELEKEFKKVSGSLESIGLSAYESKAYIALVAHGYGNAELIAKTAQIPRTSAYSVLKSLEAKGFAIATSGRPVIYKPEPPAKIYERVRADLEETFQKLEMIHEILRERGEPQLVFTITGKDKVIEKIGELLAGHSGYCDNRATAKGS